MGYETTLYIGHPLDENDRPQYVNVVASVYLGKVGPHEGIGLRTPNEPRYYIVPFVGPHLHSVSVAHDDYGDVLSVGTVDEVICGLISLPDSSGVVGVALATLRALREERIPNLVVLGYGH